MKRYLIGLVALCISSGALALDLGLPKAGGGGGGGNIEESVAGFVGRSRLMSETSAKSLAAIDVAFANEKDAADKRAEWEAIDKTTDPKERDAKLAKYNESQMAALDKRVKSGELEGQVKALSAEKQKNVASAAFNLLLAVLNAPKLADDGQKILSGASLTNAMKIVPVKDALPLIQNFMKNGVGTFGGFAKVLKGAKVELPEPSASSKEAPVAI